MRIRIFFSTLLLLMFNVAALFAQSGDPNGPCGLNDDDNTNCPLDTWVVALAVVAVIFAAVHLHKKQKRASLEIRG